MTKSWRLAAAAAALSGGFFVPAHADFEQEDLVCETTTHTGTGRTSIDLSGTACTNYLTFAGGGVDDGDTVTVTIVSGDGKIETGHATFNDAGPDTLTDYTVLASSDGIATALNLAGTSNVYLQWNSYSYGGGVGVWDIDTLTAEAINLGNPDTTLSRLGAGRFAVEGVEVPTVAGTGLSKSANTLNCDAASTTAAGCPELATNAEAETGTDTTRAVTPAGVSAALDARPQSFIVALSDEATPIDPNPSQADVFTFPMPYDFMVQGVGCSLNSPTAAGTVTVDINENNVSILSTKITIDATETSSQTAAIFPVVSDSALAAGAEIEFDIDDDGDGTATGLKCVVGGVPS